MINELAPVLNCAPVNASKNSCPSMGAGWSEVDFTITSANARYGVRGKKGLRSVVEPSSFLPW